MIIDVTAGISPRFLGFVPQGTNVISLWKDVKVYGSVGFICSEAPGFGIQHINLKQLAATVAGHDGGSGSASSAGTAAELPKVRL